MPRPLGPDQGHTVESDALGPLPEANTPGHHPDEEQDKPIEAFKQRARARSRAQGPRAQARAQAKAPQARAPQAKAPQASRRTPAAATEPDVVDAGPEAQPHDPAQPSTPPSSPAPPSSTTPTPPSSPTPGPPSTPTPPWTSGPPGTDVGRALLGVVVPAIPFLDAAVRPGRQWVAIGESRLGWMARIALLPVVGPLRYEAVRSRLDGR